MDAPDEETKTVRRSAVIGFGSVVALAWALALESPSDALDPRAKAAIVGLGLAYFLLALWFHWTRNRDAVAAYFIAQNALAVGVVWIGRGVSVLVPLAIIAQSVLQLRRRWLAVIAALHGANWVLVWGHTYGWIHATKGIGGFLTAEVFVIAFAEVVAGERRARAEAKDANRKLAEYATQAEELATIQERNRLARELHDSLGHYLTIVHVHIQAATDHLDARPECARQALIKAARLTHEGLEDVRRSVAALRASPMDERPLAAAIARLVEQMTASGVPVQFSVAGTTRPLSPAIELAIYRTAQEALTNVQKHARASEAKVHLDYGTTRVRLSVDDDGAGKTPFVMGFGLLGVRERIRLIGGEFEVSCTRGFSVTAMIPVAAKAT